ncbi:MAG: UDP-N-acetylglucosamine--N-acetylmuramyl-(pentapeptide) pyrophosphoryl-undecaprenol N-acetylglucosamine transferase [Actinomycetes bacterium]
MTRYLLAGGGTAGHVNPLLALADAIKAQPGDHQIWALGTVEGLESRLVPERGIKLLTVDRLPMPRKLNAYAFTFPLEFAKAVNIVKQYIKDYQIDVVVGFGGYASAPAYRAAKALNIPYVVHEANALAGYANKVGARKASAVAITFANTNLPKAKLTGLPLRKEIVELTKTDQRFAANKFFGLDSKLTTLLVTGGSLGAKSINDTIEKSRTLLEAAGVQVIHIVGDRAGLEELTIGGYRRISYCSRMELAIAAADFAVARAGAATVSEFTAVGLPAIFVPYPVGNGEQRLNAEQVVTSGGAKIVSDQDFTPEYVASALIPLLSNKKAVTTMQEKSREVGIVTGSEDLLKLVNGVLY